MIHTIFGSFVQATSSAKEALGSKLLETIEDQGRVEKFIRLFVHDLIEDFPSGKESISREFTYQTTHIYPELTEKAIEKNKRIVGGCGMQLTTQCIQPSKKAEEVLQSNWSRLLALRPETWEIVDTEDGSKGALFRLLLEDVPPWLIDDYCWMESFLLVPKGTTAEVVEGRIQLQEAMSANNQADFTRYLEEIETVEELPSRDGATLLHQAATMQNPFYVRALLDKGLSLFERDAHGYLPIHYAAMAGSVEIIALFIVKDKRVLNATSHYGSTPLIVAIQHGQAKAVSTLLANGPDPSLLAGGYTDLHCALHEGNLEIIEALLCYEPIVSFSITVCSEEGGTPLMLACELGNAELIKKLIQKGANASAKRKDGTTAIEIAVMRGDTSTLEVLLQYAAPSGLAIETAAREGSVEIMKLLTAVPGVLEHTNICKDTILHTALLYGNARVALYLTKYPQLLDLKNVEDYTPFTLAVLMRHWEVAEILFNAGVSIDFLPLLRAEYHPLLDKVFDSHWLSSEELQNYLLIAAEAGNHFIINRILVPKGAQIEKLNGPKGWKIAHYFAKSNGVSVLRELVTKSGDLLAPLRQEGNKTLAYIAAEHASSHVLLYLVRQMKEKKISLQNHYLDRHLFYGVLESGHIGNVKEILEIDGSLVNECLNKQEMRPIHIAAKSGRGKIIELLIEKEANCSVRDKENKTPLYYAIRSGSKKCVSLLLKQKVPIRAMDIYEAASLPPPFRHKMLKHLLQAHPLQDSVNAALYLAIENHNDAAFTQLYEAGASFTYVTTDGWTPLLLASKTGQIDMLKAIVAQSISNESVEGNNALHVACIHGHAHCVKLLLERGFGREPNEQGQTPVELAKDKKNVEDVLQGKETYETYLKDYKHALESDDAPRMKEVVQKLPFEEPIFIEYQGKRVWGTPFQLLVRFWKEKKVQEILSQILPNLSNPNLRDSEGNTIAHFIANIGQPLLHIPNIDLLAGNYLGQTPLHVAAQEAESTILQALLDVLPASAVHAVDRGGRTPIFYAIKEGKEKNVSLLIKRGASVRHRDHQLFTPLFVACARGSLSILKALITGGADSNQWATSKKLFPLQITMAQKQSELTRYLLLHGAKRLPMEKDGSHPIHHAAQSGDLESLRMFVGMGDSLELKDHIGKGAKHYAVLNEQMDSLKTIWNFEQEALAEEYELFGKSLEGLELYWKSEDNTINAPLKLKKDPKDDEIHPLEGANLVHLAARSSTPEMVDWLLEHRVLATTKTANEKDALSFAAQSPLAPAMLKRFSAYEMSKNLSSIQQAIVETIRQDHLEAMISLYKDTFFPTSSILHGNNGLHLACYFGAIQCTAWFLQQGVDPSYEGQSKKSSFELSAENKCPEQFQLLLEYTNHDPSERYRTANTLLHNAARGGQLKHVALLLLRGAAVNVMDAMGFTPLHHAVQREDLEIVRLLLACGADSSIKATVGALPVELLWDCPIIGAAIRKAIEDSENLKEYAIEERLRLHLAVASSHPVAVLLLTHLQDVDEQDSKGQTPLHLAIQRGDIESALYLLRAGADDEMQDHLGHTPLWYAEKAPLPLREKMYALFQKEDRAV